MSLNDDRPYGGPHGVLYERCPVCGDPEWRETERSAPICPDCCDAENARLGASSMALRKARRNGFMEAVEKFRHFKLPGHTLTEEEVGIIEIACQIIEDQAP